MKARRQAPTAALAAWVARTPPIRSGPALSLAKHVLKDSSACMVAGARDEATLLVSRVAHGRGTGPCSVRCWSTRSATKEPTA